VGRVETDDIQQPALLWPKEVQESVFEYRSRPHRVDHVARVSPHHGKSHFAPATRNLIGRNFVEVMESNAGRTVKRRHHGSYLGEMSPAPVNLIDRGFWTRPDNEAPGRIQVSTGLRLSTGSKLRLPPTPTRVTRNGKNLRSSSVMDLVRKVGLRTQS
jgi:hypothetical protein